MKGTERASAPGGPPHSPLRSLPAVDRLLRHPALAPALAAYGREAVVAALRAALAAVREAWWTTGGTPAADAASPGAMSDRLVAAALARLEEAEEGLLRPVINATGVVLHTNLGRSPLSAAAVEAVAAVARGYSNLEYDLARGERGFRHVHGERLLRQITGAEAALVVNNNAAAILLVLTALTAGRAVILSRGEMIEIGGSFRIPDVMAQSGATLREIGTTNRTHLADYERAIDDQTAALLKVHRSNFRLSGFTAEATGRELAMLAHRRGVLAICDLGSGVLLDTRVFGLGREPTIQAALADGLDVVTASGDKLLGGPQTGLILGRRDLVERCRRHPLARAVRVDKLALAALQATLRAYARGEAATAVPIWRMMGEPVEALEERAGRVARELDQLPGLAVRVEAAESAIGGGSLPEERLPTRAVALMPADGDVDGLAARLRRQKPPVVGRIADGALLLDLRTVAPEEEPLLAAAVAAAVRFRAGS